MKVPRTREGQTFRSMWSRCTNPNDQAYARYGGVGVSVCSRWRDFGAFLEDMGPRPDATSLDRIDHNLPYCKENCRWADRKTQNRNRSTARFITLDGETRQLAEWAEILGVNRRLIQSRVAAGCNTRADMQPRRERSGSRTSRKGRYVTVDGITLKLSEWAKRTGISRTTITQRIKYGWAIEDAVSKPKSVKARPVS